MIPIASIKPITPIDKIGIDKAVIAKTNIEVLATVVKALIEGIIKNR